MPVLRTTGSAPAVLVLASVSGDMAALLDISRDLRSLSLSNGSDAMTAAASSLAGLRASGHAFFRASSPSWMPSSRE